MRTKRLPDAEQWLHPEPRRLTSAEVAEHEQIAAQVTDLPLFRQRREEAMRRKGVAADGA